MAPRTGRPTTGRTPNVSIRLDPRDYHAARVAAVTASKTLGQWLGEAIREKIGREGIQSDERAVITGGNKTKAQR